MKKVVLILLILTGIGYGYFEQNFGNPAVYFPDGTLAYTFFPEKIDMNRHVIWNVSDDATGGSLLDIDFNGGDFGFEYVSSTGIHVWIDGASVAVFDDGIPVLTLGSLLIDDPTLIDVTLGFDADSNNQGTFTYESDNALLIWDKDLQLAVASKILFRDSAIGQYSQADTFMDLFADGAVRVGNSSAGAPTTYIAVEPDADTYWVGAGTGLPYGHIYVDGTQSIIIALTVNTPAEVLDDGTTSSGDGWLAGEMNLVTFPTGGDEHYMSITKAGVYSVTWDLSFNMASPGANVEIHGGMAVDGTPVRDKGEGHRTIANNSDTGNMGGTLIIDCPNGTEQISLWLENTTNNSDVTAIHGNINIMMVGGT